jgi:hypothetical protein
MTTWTAWMATVAATVVMAGCTLPTVPQQQQQGQQEQQPAEAGEKPAQPAPGAAAGSIPSTVVGHWGRASSTTVVLYELNADGTYRFTGGADNDMACTKIIIVDEGVATFSGNKVTFEMQKGETTTTPCSGAKETHANKPYVETKNWRVENDVIFFWGDDCDGSEACAESYERS